MAKVLRVREHVTATTHGTLSEVDAYLRSLAQGVGAPIVFLGIGGLLSPREVGGVRFTAPSQTLASKPPLAGMVEGMEVIKECALALRPTP